jgi:hypothetical protein
MLKTDDIFEMVQDEVKLILKEEPSMETLIGDMKKIVMKAMTKKGITIDDSISVSAKLIVLSAMVR